jgi:pSer/pThr/pTyr-binding forkhead associated (FHA) protein
MEYGFLPPQTTEAYLIVNSKVFPLKNEITTIGRTLDNDLIIQEPTISRHHAKILRKGDSFIIVDLQSTAGTFINKFKVNECALYSGDLILVANVPIMFINQGFQVSDDTHSPTSSLFGMQMFE